MPIATRKRKRETKSTNLTSVENEDMIPIEVPSDLAYPCSSAVADNSPTLDAQRSQFPNAPRKSLQEKFNLIGQIAAIKLQMTKSALSNARPTHTSGIAASGFATVCDKINEYIPVNKFFIPGRSFPIRMRHSNCYGKYNHDGGLEPRGCAIKFSDSVSYSPLDLVLHTGELMGFFNLDTYREFSSAQVRYRSNTFITIFV